MPASLQQAEHRYPGSSTPGAYASPAASRTLTGMLVFDSPPLVSGLRSTAGTLSHFSYQPGAGPYSPGTLSIDGMARDSAVRSLSLSLVTFQAHAAEFTNLSNLRLARAEGMSEAEPKVVDGSQVQ